MKILRLWPALIVAACWLVPALIACNAAQLAAVQSADQTAMTLTGAACDLAATQPLGQPWTDFVCEGVEAVEAVVSDVPGGAAAVDAGAPPPPATLQPGQTALVHVPAAQVSSFLERHPRRTHRSATTVTVTPPGDAGPG